MDNTTKYIEEPKEINEIVSSKETKEIFINKNEITTLLQNKITIIDRLDNLIGKYIDEKWTYQELISGKIIHITDNFVHCECLISRDNSYFQIRQFDKSLFESLPEITIDKFVKIRLSKKSGTQRIDVIDGEGLGLESDFNLEDDDWNIFDKLDLTEPQLR